LSEHLESAAIRARLSHPVIDADGHMIEFMPAVRDHLVEVGGAQLAAEFDAVLAAPAQLDALPEAERRAMGLFKLTWWAYPARNALDRATGMLPALLYDRLDEFGLDFAVLYPTVGLTAMSLMQQTDLRRAGVRAFNRCAAEMYAPYADRLTPVAMIPMLDPGEAIDELEYVVNELGLRAVLLNGLVYRPLAPDLPGGARWVDTFGVESPYDYESVWAKCVELGVAPTFHSSSMGWGSRVSQRNYVHNHIGNFAQAGEATCRSLFMHGVPQRHPKLRMAFLEGGAGWACNLYSDLIGHLEKRGPEGIRAYDPELMDRDLIRRLFEQHGSPRFKKHLDELEEGLALFSRAGDYVDDFAASGVRTAEDVRNVFERNFRFGCEADDPMNAVAFDARINPLGAKLRAIFSSDIGHWDVPEMAGVVAEAWELVDDGLLSEDDFHAFTFSNAATMWAEANPRFFDGTKVEEAVNALAG
jgi:predicted TIM-barrel fold metal-dependent hydrolase